ATVSPGVELKVVPVILKVHGQYLAGKSRAGVEVGPAGRSVVPGRGCLVVDPAGQLAHVAGPLEELWVCLAGPVVVGVAPQARTPGLAVIDARVRRSCHG